MIVLARANSNLLDWTGQQTSAGEGQQQFTGLDWTGQQTSAGEGQQQFTGLERINTKQ
jgi:hypothetical protein